MKQQKNAIVPASPAQQAISTKALSFKGEIVAYHQAAHKAAEEAMENLFQCGRLLEEVKAVLKADKTTSFGEWCEQFCDISSSSAYSYCKLFQDLREFTKFQRAGIFTRYNSQRAVQAFLTDQRKTAEPKPETTSVASLDEPEATIPTSPPPASLADRFASDIEEDTGGGGEPEPDLDLGKCPNCAGTKWTDDDDGPVCSKCHHPHGEPTGGADEDRIKTQRQKTIKTVEALQRAFDDLHLLLPKVEHKEAADTCKVLLRMAKGWK